MDSATQGITPLRQRMIDDMRMRQFADKTQSHYIHAVRQLAAFLGHSPDTATVEDLRRYQLHLVDRGTLPVSLNAALAGLKFFFEVTLGDGDLMAKMEPVRVPRTLPVVLSRDEVARLLAATRNLKHETALSVAYGAGLRASAVTGLKVGDVGQSAHDPAHRAGEGAQGSLRHAAAAATRAPAHLVAGGPGAGQDARWWLWCSRCRRVSSAVEPPSAPAAPVAIMAPTFVCPHCGAAMSVVEIFARGQPIRAPPTLRVAA
jgi:site-specific recombinase XerC